MKKGGYFFRTILIFIIAFVIQTAGVLVVAILKGFLTGQEGSPLDWLMAATDLTGDPKYLLLSLLTYAALSIIIFGFWYRGRFIRPFRTMQRNYPGGFTLLTILTLVITGFGIQFIGESFVSLMSKLTPNLVSSYSENIANLGIGSSFSPLMLLYVIFVGPIAEEIIFRGLIYRFARLSLPFWLANVWQAALFGLFHMNVIQGLYAFVFGLILGYIAHRGHGIRYSLVAHIAANALGCFFAGFFGTLAGSFAGITLLIGIILALFAMFVFSVEFHPLHKTEPLSRDR